MEINITKNANIVTPCLICGETVDIFEPHETPKICEKCRIAVMAVREVLTELKKMKEKGEFPHADGDE